MARFEDCHVTSICLKINRSCAVLTRKTMCFWRLKNVLYSSKPLQNYNLRKYCILIGTSHMVKLMTSPVVIICQRCIAVTNFKVTSAF